MALKYGAWILGWLLASLPGCSGKAVGGGGNSNDAAGVQDCTGLLTVTCEKAIACEPLISQTVYGDVPGCVALLSQFCTAIAELPGYGPLVSDYAACAAAYRAASCDSLISGDLPPACQTKPGSLADGSPCAAGGQCQSTYCQLEYATDSDCGVCAPRIPLGGTCEATGGCVEGLVCGSGTGATCVEPGLVGQNCDPAHPCRTGLHCTNGACAALLGAGAPCASFAECDYRQGLWCTSGVCQPITVAGSGETCDNSGRQCRAGNYCSESPDGGTGTCVARQPNGSPCEDSRECGLVSECTNGVCAAYQYPSCP